MALKMQQEMDVETKWRPSVNKQLIDYAKSLMSNQKYCSDPSGWFSQRQSHLLLHNNYCELFFVLFVAMRKYSAASEVFGKIPKDSVEVITRNVRNMYVNVCDYACNYACVYACVRVCVCVCVCDLFPPDCVIC